MSWRGTGLPRFYLQPAHVCFVEETSILETVLGSCVSLTLWDPQRRAGAMSHSVLPVCPVDYAEREFARYVDASIEYTVRRFERLGIERKRLQAKIFGGSDVLPTLVRPLLPATVGRQNAAVALRTLARLGIFPAARDLGGRNGRKVAFHTGSGEVRIWRLPELTVFGRKGFGREQE